MKAVIGQAKKKRKTIGTFVDNIKMLNLWGEAGVQYLSYNVDIGIFTDACNALMREIKKQNNMSKTPREEIKQVLVIVSFPLLFMQSIGRWYK